MEKPRLKSKSDRSQGLHSALPDLPERSTGVEALRNRTQRGQGLAQALSLILFLQEGNALLELLLVGRAVGGALAEQSSQTQKGRPSSVLSGELHRPESSAGADQARREDSPSTQATRPLTTWRQNRGHRGQAPSYPSPQEKSRTTL